VRILPTSSSKSGLLPASSSKSAVFEVEIEHLLQSWALFVNHFRR
jgi:hypothetical protein